MRKDVPPGKKRFILFFVVLVPLCYYLLLVGNQFRADRDIRRAREDRNSLEEAERWMARALCINPGDADAWNDLGNIHQIRSQEEDTPAPARIEALKKAEGCYRKAIREVPTNSTSHINLGWTRYQIDELNGRPPGPRVKKSFELAVRLEPFNYYPHLLLADYLLFEGKEEEAFREFHRAILAHPHHEVIKAIIEKAMAKTTDLDTLKQVIPEDEPLAHWLFAVALQDKLDRWEESKKEIQKVFELDPQNTYYRDRYLNYCLSLPDVPAALQEVEDRQKVLGEDPEILIKLADFLKNQGEFDQAMDLCRRVQEIAPGIPRTTTLMAEIKTGQGNLVEAVKAYQAHLEKHPKDPEGYFRLGLLYQGNGNKYRAAELFLQAASLAPDQAPIQSRLADAYLQLSMLDRALEVLERCRQIDPDEIQYNLKSGKIHMSREDWMEAALDFGEVLKKEPGHPEALQGFLKAQSRIQ